MNVRVESFVRFGNDAEQADRVRYWRPPLSGSESGTVHRC